MGISDKEAFRILELPLGVDRDAIRDRYKQMSSKLSSSKCPEDKKRLEIVVAAYSQLLPTSISKQLQCNRSPKGGKNSKNSNLFQCYDSDASSSEDDSVRAPCRNGDSRNTHIMKGDEIMDSERDKRKAERRRAKKKRRKEKKKLEKLENKYCGIGNIQRDDDSDSQDEDDNIEEEGIDPKSAFVAVAGKKISNIQPWKQQEDNKKIHNKINTHEDTENSTIQLDPEARHIQSRQLAIKGNEEANNGQYDRAVRLFSEAIRLECNDHRFFGNRSYCYDQLGQYEKALKDADRSIKLAPEWPKGHFRRGRALKGLGKYAEAEAAFQKVLRFDEECEDALTEIIKVRRKRIVEMGFTPQQARAAIKKYNNVQPALDALLAGEFIGTSENVFYSDEEDIIEEPIRQPPPPPAPVAADVKMNPRNPEGLTSLWVGNVVPEVNEKQLTKVFNKHGTVTSVRLLKEKYCAFVNFSDKTGASRAMAGLQGFDLGGSKLLIKFPDNPIVNGTTNVVIRKNKPPVNKNNTSTQNQATNNVSQSLKSKGPVNGNECYFWRTTGCAFGDTCKHDHIPNYKGIDRKPWQK